MLMGSNAFYLPMQPNQYSEEEKKKLQFIAEKFPTNLESDICEFIDRNPGIEANDELLTLFKKSYC